MKGAEAMSSECDEDHFFLDNLTCSKCRRSFSSGTLSIRDRKFLSGICADCGALLQDDANKKATASALHIERNDGYYQMQKAKMAAAACGLVLAMSLFGTISTSGALLLAWLLRSPEAIF